MNDATPFSPTALVGTISLLSAYAVAAWCVAAGIAGNARRSRRLINSSVYGLYGFAALITLSSVLLIYAFVTHDFTIKYVASVSDTTMETWYKVTSFWGGLDGSLLFWVFVLSLFSTVAILVNHRRHRDMIGFVVATIMVVQVFFLSLLIFTKNPFATSLTAPPVDGQGRALDAIQPQQGHGAAFADRAHLSGPQGSGQHLGAGRGGRPFEDDRQHPRLDLAAALHARGGLLADETALLEVDAAEQVEIGLYGIDRLGTPVGRSRHAQGQAMGLIGGLLDHLRVGGRRGPIAAQAQGGQARIGAPSRPRQRPRKQRQDRGVVGGDLHLGAQPVHGQALDDRLALARRDVQPTAVGLSDQEHVVEQPALGRQQGRQPGFAPRQGFDILGEQALQEVAPARAAHRHQGSALQDRACGSLGHDDAIRRRAGGAPAI